MYLPSQGKALPLTLETLRGRSDAVAVTSTRAIIGEPGVSPVNPGGNAFDGPGQSYTMCDASGCHGSGDPAANQAPSGEAIELQLIGITGDIRQFRPYRPESGQWLSFSSEPSLSLRIVINRQAAKGFALHRVPAEMRIDGATANPTPRIIGVVDGRSCPAHRCRRHPQRRARHRG
jgi:putative ABC transport system permease protein